MILDKFQLDADCPKCGFFNSITIKQIRLRDVIICRGCKITIQLDDYMNETKKIARNFEKTINQMKNIFK